MAIRIIMAALLVALASATIAADFDAGVTAYDRGDYAVALREFRPLAEQGDARAQFYLGFMYSNGDGVPHDFAEAVAWYRRAAEQGCANAQHNLGLMYAFGEGVPEDYVQGYAWFNLAAAQGGKQAKEFRDNLRSRMTRDQVAEAQELSRELDARINRR